MTMRHPLSVPEGFLDPDRRVTASEVRWANSMRDAAKRRLFDANFHLQRDIERATLRQMFPGCTFPHLEDSP